MPKNKTLPLQIYNFFLYLSPIGQFFTNIGLKFIKNFSQKSSNFATEKKIEEISHYN